MIFLDKLKYMRIQFRYADTQREQLIYLNLMQLLYLNFTQEQCTTHLTVHVITEDLFISEIIQFEFYFNGGYI